MDKQDELIQRVVDHLAGRPVKIRWQPPQRQNATGQAYKTKAGQAVIDIDPNQLNVEDRLRDLLHETTHVAADFSYLPILDDRIAPGSVIRSESERKAWRKNPRELRAEGQAKYWLDYALLHANDHYQAGRSPLECALYALLAWEDPLRLDRPKEQVKTGKQTNPTEAQRWAAEQRLKGLLPKPRPGWAIKTTPGAKR